jgi:8-amino-7-oxononanoate synthase
VLSALTTALEAELADLARRDRLRRVPALAGSSRVHVTADGQPALSFSSNDYLGLATHPAVCQAAALATSSQGFGAAASRLVSGDLPSHRSFEAALAAFLGTEAALLFPTGYQANLGVLTALAGRDDLIVSDALNHASLIDGCRLSRATVRIYEHANPAAARALLTAPEAARYRRRFLVTESLFSMDGDLAPLPELAEVASSTDTALVLDEAHAIGVLGPAGRGLAAANAILPDVLVGTLGKAFGSFGGFVAGTHTLRAALENRARSFVFTTAAPPCIPAAAEAALRIIDSSEGEQRRASLAANIQHLQNHLPPAPRPTPRPALPTPIVPFIVGPDAAALEVAAALRAEGFFVQPIRPPTVPEGTARLRITLSAAHTSQEIDALAAALSRSLRHP